jgi:hypothetical protein
LADFETCRALCNFENVSLYLVEADGYPRCATT